MRPCKTSGFAGFVCAKVIFEARDSHPSIELREQIKGAIAGCALGAGWELLLRGWSQGLRITIWDLIQLTTIVALAAFVVTQVMSV